MSVGYYMDENVPGPIVRGLRRRGVNVLTATEDGYSARPDPDILDRATALGRVLYTEDDDLLAEAGIRQASGLEFAGVVYVHQFALGFGQRVQDLEVIAKAGDLADYVNQVIYLPL